MDKDKKIFDSYTVSGVMKDLAEEVWTLQGKPNTKTVVYQKTRVYDAFSKSRTTCLTRFIPDVELKFGQSVIQLEDGEWGDFEKFYWVKIESDAVRARIWSALDQDAQQFLRIQERYRFFLSEVRFLENFRRKSSELVLKLATDLDLPDRILKRVVNECEYPGRQFAVDKLSHWEIMSIVIKLRQVLIDLFEEEIVATLPSHSSQDSEACLDRSYEGQPVDRLESVLG